MDHQNKFLQTEEVHSQCIKMIETNLLGIQQQIFPLKDYISNRKKDIIKRSANVGRSKYNILGCTRAFYKHMLNELMEMEQICQKSLLRLKIDLLNVTRDRMQPPSYLSAEEIDTGLKICCDAMNQAKDELPCCYVCKNSSDLSLEDTENVASKPKKSVKTLFDESDMKFKQDIIYLRTKMLALPRQQVGSSKNGITSEFVHGSPAQTDVELSLHPKEFMDVLKQTESPELRSVEHELSKVTHLKFINGSFKESDSWSKALDIHGNQYGSKWHLVLRPQVERIAKKRMISILHLNPRATFNFLSRIKENGANFELRVQDLIGLVGNEAGARCLESWKSQFRMIDGVHKAVTMIQAIWRGYSLRKKKRHSDRMYIAASYVWYSWLSLKHNKILHQRYLDKMLISLQTTREITLKFSKEFDSIREKPHIIIHIPSAGLPLDVRSSLDPTTFRMYQNVVSMRICMVRNPKSELIYVLPVKPTHDLLMMYSDFVESLCPSDEVAKRITFIVLSQLETFRKRPMNVSKILHCSERSLVEIKKKIAGKSAYILPWYIDECDLKLAGRLNVPLLSPDLELHNTMVNYSDMADMVEKLGLQQPVHAKHIRDYKTLCTTLANFMVLHTEICVWIIKLNYGILNKHFGLFVINHISVPFMLYLRKERQKHGNNWLECSTLRDHFLQKMLRHLPKVVSSMTRLSNTYKTWKEFYDLLQKYGCLLQAVPAEKNSKTVLVSLFFHENNKPLWIGTADKLNLESEVISTLLYMLPQSSVETKELQYTVNKFARGMQKKGYFGYLTIDCYCYTDKYEKLVVLVEHVRPYYSSVQSYVDWMKFASGGKYFEKQNDFISDVPIIADVEKEKTFLLISNKPPKWNETKERVGIVIGQIYHTGFSEYRWSQLKDLFDRYDIVFDSQKREGTSILLHDSEIRNFGFMLSVGSNMKDTLIMVQEHLTKLNEGLSAKLSKKYETNLPSLIDFFGKLALDYEDLDADPCPS